MFVTCSCTVYDILRHPHTEHQSSLNFSCCTLSHTLCFTVVAPCCLQVDDFATGLGLDPSDAVVLLLAEVKAGRDVSAMLSPGGLRALAKEWAALSDRVNLPVSRVTAALAEQVRRPGAR